MASHSEHDTLFQKEMVPHMTLLYNFALRTTNNVDDAKDLLQDTYLKAYRFINKFQQGSNAKAWLFRIMKNSYINDYRKNARSPEQVNYDDIQDYYDLVRDHSSNDSNDLRHQFYDNLLEDEVVTAMETLDEEFRTIIILYYSFRFRTVDVRRNCQHSGYSIGNCPFAITSSAKVDAEKTPRLCHSQRIHFIF